MTDALNDALRSVALFVPKLAAFLVILLVGWLRQRHRIVQITICVLIIPPAVTVLLRVIVLLFGLRD